jgi:hypothetical protein
MYGYVGQVQTFAVHNTALAEPGYLASLAAERQAISPTDKSSQQLAQLAQSKPTVAAHRLQPGDGLVIGYRSFTPGTLIDGDESYQKTTIWLKAIPEQGEVSLDNAENIKTVVSKGSVRHLAMSCAGYLHSGKLRLESAAGGYQLQITAQFAPLATTELQDYCEAGEFDLSFYAPLIGWPDINPWLGKLAENIVDEVQP